ncbi:hypothetical protein [Actinomadura rubrisoli]|uniref:hypothetical protein n=1 Tax=Actinomadura rubrisoli TaxID=2530368 RepID=UPI001404D02A|nr:hypothetical protein [Actinomadura rubrisoli]
MAQHKGRDATRDKPYQWYYQRPWIRQPNAISAATSGNTGGQAHFKMAAREWTTA